MFTPRTAKRGDVRFQTRLLVRYSLLVFFLVVVLGITFYAYTSRLFEDNAASTYRLLSSRISLHLDNLIHPMDFITTNLISDSNFRSGLITLATLNRSDSQNSPFINEAAQAIRSDLMTYSIQKNFYSVVVVTRAGDFFSSNFVNHGQVDSEVLPFTDLPGYAAAREARGRAVVVPPHNDPWDTRARVRVYGLARVVPGPDGDLAFIEVQNPIADLDALFSVPNRNYVRILAIQSDGTPFYESAPTSPELLSYYLAMSERSEGTESFRRNPLTGKSELVISAKSSYTGMRTILILNRDVLLRPLAFVGWTTAGVGLLIILASVLYNWFSSARLTEPLRLIRRRMEETELSNLPGQKALDHENDEIVALDRSFQRLRGRLDEAIRRELRSRTLWLQSRLDSLQAQVNPHFLYNILTVIAGKGLELGNEEIAEICDAIAAMLRYSTSTTVRSATVAEELEHVRAYLFLMKKRFENRLDFAFEVDQEILTVAIPKIVLQQIVENSINHAYRNLEGPMSIRVRGYRSEERWMIEISDNGQGFDPVVLQQLRAKMASFDVQHSSKDESSGMEIGGLGLLNTYTRLHLFYRGDFVFEMENAPSCGARIAIGGTLAPAEKVDNDVYSSTRRG